VLRYHKTLLIWTQDLAKSPSQLEEEQEITTPQQAPLDPALTQIKSALMAVLYENPKGVSLA